MWAGESVIDTFFFSSNARIMSKTAGMNENRGALKSMESFEEITLENSNDSSEVLASHVSRRGKVF